MKLIPTPVFDGENGGGTPPAGTPPAGTPPAASILGTPPAATPPAGTPPAATPPAGTPPPAASWVSKLSAEEQAYATNKGWTADTDPAVIMQSYQNLEKMVGADKAGRTVVLPKDANDKATSDVLWEKLGKPKDFNEYKIELPQGADATFSNTAKQAMHKANLTSEQATAMSQWYQAAELDRITEITTRHADEVQGLQKDWGANFDGNINTARAGWTAGGFTPEQIKAMEYAVGPNAFAKGFEKIGQSFKEAGPPGNDTRGASGFQNLTPDAARARQTQLRSDPAFMARYNHSDPAMRAGAIEEMSKLAAIETGGR